MKTMQLNSEFFAVMSQVADDEAILKKIINYANRRTQRTPQTLKFHSTFHTVSSPQIFLTFSLKGLFLQ